jgi:MSHA biogenesis protein MshP
MRPNGFAIVSALFLIVALAALGAAIMHFTSVQQVAGAQDIQGARALAAARAGTEWQAAVILAQETSGNPQYACAAPASFAFAGFDLAVSCAHSDHAEEGNTVRVYRITSTASAGGAVGTLGFVERQVYMVVSTCRNTPNGALC